MVESLASLAPGGRLVINAIRKEDVDRDQLLRLNYHEHLWVERKIKTVANVTHSDIRDFPPDRCADSDSTVRTDVCT